MAQIDATTATEPMRNILIRIANGTRNAVWGRGGGRLGSITLRRFFPITNPEDSPRASPREVGDAPGA